MSTFIKYRVHEVAKDFGLGSKDVSNILTEYASTPKNHMQVLTEPELDVIFEYLTQHNQVASIEEIYAETPAKETAGQSKNRRNGAKRCKVRKTGKGTAERAG